MTVVVTFKIDEETLTLIDSLARNLNTTRSALIRLALNELLYKYRNVLDDDEIPKIYKLKLRIRKVRV